MVAVPSVSVTTSPEDQCWIESDGLLATEPLMTVLVLLVVSVGVLMLVVKVSLLGEGAMVSTK